MTKGLAGSSVKGRAEPERKAPGSMYLRKQARYTPRPRVKRAAPAVPSPRTRRSKSVEEVMAEFRQNTAG